MGLVSLLHKVPFVKKAFSAFKDAEARFHVGVLLVAVGALGGDLLPVFEAFDVQRAVELIGGLTALSGSGVRVWEKLVNEDLNKDGRVG